MDACQTQERTRPRPAVSSTSTSIGTLRARPPAPSSLNLLLLWLGGPCVHLALSSRPARTSQRCLFAQLLRPRCLHGHPERCGGHRTSVADAANPQMDDMQDPRLFLSAFALSGAIVNLTLAFRSRQGLTRLTSGPHLGPDARGCSADAANCPRWSHPPTYSHPTESPGSRTLAADPVGLRVHSSRSHQAEKLACTRPSRRSPLPVPHEGHQPMPAPRRPAGGSQGGRRQPAGDALQRGWQLC